MHGNYSHSPILQSRPQRLLTYCSTLLPCHHRSGALDEENLWLSTLDAPLDETGNSSGCAAPTFDGSMPKSDFDVLDAALVRRGVSTAIVVCHR